MRVRILKPPRGYVDGMRIDQLRVGRTYDLPANVASLLIVESCAQMEMRAEGHAHKPGRKASERRRK